MPSTAIRRFSHDAQSLTLFVTFIDGDVYAYRGVASDVHQGFKEAFSKGRYFSQHIRDRFPYAKLPQAARGPAQGTEARGGRSLNADHANRDGARHERTPP